MPLTYPKRQGFILSHKSAIFSFDSDEVRGLKSVKVTPTVEGREEAADNGVIVLGRTRGQAKVELEFVWNTGWCLQWIKNSGRTRGFLMQTGIAFGAVYQELGVIERCEVPGITFTALPFESEGTAAMESTLKAMGDDVLINGESIFDTLGT